MAEKYISRYGKVWQKKGSKTTLGKEIELKEGDSIGNYTQVKMETAKTKNTFNTEVK